MLVASKSGPATIGATAACLIGATVVSIAGELRRKASLLMLGAAVILAAFLTIRTSPWLVSLNAIMIVALGISAASYNRSGNLWGPMSTIVRRVFRSMFSVPGGASVGLTAVASLLPTPSEQTPDRRAAASSTFRGALFAAPLLLVMLALFASADPVFASYLYLPTVSSGWFNNLAVVAIGAVFLLGLTRLAKTTADDPVLKRKAGSGELAIVLGGFVVLYTAFAFTQIMAAVGGSTYVNERTDGSYKEYARSGFFQLLIASAITLVLLFIARGSLERNDGIKTRSVRILSVMLCGLSIVVVLGSMQRIALYSQEFGQTMLRVYSSTFAGWLGVVFALIGLAAMVPAKRQWIAPAALALAVAGLIGMNLYNPEARVAKNNLDRALATGDLYTTYFSKLSADAVPTIANGIEKLGGDLKKTSTTQVCEFLRENPALRPDNGFLTFNQSQRNATAAVRKLCGKV
jgi:MFS family permease